MPYDEYELEEYTKSLEQLPDKLLEALRDLLLAATVGEKVDSSKSRKMEYETEKPPLLLAEDYPKYHILKDVIAKILTNEKLRSGEIKVGIQAIKHRRESLQFEEGNKGVQTVNFDDHTPPDSVKKRKTFASSSHIQAKEKPLGKYPKLSFAELINAKTLTESKIMGAFQTALPTGTGKTKEFTLQMLDKTLYKLSDDVSKGGMNPDEAITSLLSMTLDNLKANNKKSEEFDRESFEQIIGKNYIRLVREELQKGLNDFQEELPDGNLEGEDGDIVKERYLKLILDKLVPLTPLPWNKQVKQLTFNLCLDNWKKDKTETIKSKTLTAIEIKQAEQTLREIIEQKDVQLVLSKFFTKLA